MAAQHPKLMIPGPVDVDDDVLAAMAEPVHPHYGREWLEIYQETSRRLKQVFCTQNDLFLIPGPGSAGLDAALGSLARTGEKVLVPANGFFGRRLGLIGRSYGLDVRTAEAPLGKPLDPEAIRRRLLDEPDIRLVAFVHLETSTGVLNPLPEILAVVQESGTLAVVDAVSTMGGMPLPVDQLGIDVCVTVSNKCLAGPAGLAIVGVNQRAWDHMDRRGGRAHGWYLNLRTWKDYALNWASWHPYPTTLPTSIILALLASLRRIQSNDLEAYYRRHVEAAHYVRAGLKRLGLQMLMPEAHASPLMTTMRGFPGLDLEDLRRYLLEEWQVMVAGGLGDLQGKVIRVGHMGRAAEQDYSDQLVMGVEAYLSLQGHDVPSSTLDRSRR